MRWLPLTDKSFKRRSYQAGVSHAMYSLSSVRQYCCLLLLLLFGLKIAAVYVFTSYNENNFYYSVYSRLQSMWVLWELFANLRGCFTKGETKIFALLLNSLRLNSKLRCEYHFATLTIYTSTIRFLIPAKSVDLCLNTNSNPLLNPSRSTKY